MDSACSSGGLAMYEAVMAIRRGECEAAIVGGANLCLRPGTSLQFYKLNMLSDDGICQTFDAACKFFEFNCIEKIKQIISSHLKRASFFLP